MLIHSIVPSLLELRSVFLHLSLNSPIRYSCILQLHVTGTLLFHLARDIDMYHVSTIQIHSDVQLYSCTAVRPYPAEIRRPFVDKYRIRIPYSGILNCTII